MLSLAALSLAAPTLVEQVATLPNASASAWRFQSKWRPELGEHLSDAALEQRQYPPLKDVPHHCDLAVVGAGWGGAYLAWRMSVDTNTISPNNVCVFEANGRVGGRIFSMRGLPAAPDLAIDAGGYRFIETDLLPAQLVWNGLQLSTACYDWQCAGGCEGSGNCYIVKDAYGNNFGYSWPIEVMLGRVEDMGDGTQVHFGFELTELKPGTGRGTELTFSNGAKVTASKVMLNIPGNAVKKISAMPGSVLKTDTSKQVQEVLDSVTVGEMQKVYVYYEDAWWASKLGLMEGYLQEPFAGGAPLQGRYHDGPLKCIIGTDPDGQPIYSGTKVQYGNCSGYIETYYTGSTTYYKQYQTDPLSPVKLLDTTTTMGKKALDDSHTSLIAFHKDELEKAGIAQSSLAKPTFMTVSNWVSDDPVAPGIGHMSSGSDAQRALARAPTATHDVYLADQDYGYRSGWAVGSLKMAEKVLQAEIGVAKPSWLDEEWYVKNVVGLDTPAHAQSDALLFNKGVNSDLPKSEL